MTDAAYVEPAPLPDVIGCTVADLEGYARRMPSPAMSEELTRHGTTFAELCSTDAGKTRYAAWRLLKKAYPDHDPTAVWLHSWFVEIEVTEVDPTLRPGPTVSPPSAPSTAAFPTTSTV